MTDARRLHARHHVGWLASVSLMLACAAPQESAGPRPTPVPLPPAAIRIKGEPNLSLTIGAGVRLSAVMKDARGVEVLVPATWSSSRIDVAPVDTAGLVNAIAYGEATITASYGGGLARVQVSTLPSALRVRQLPEGVMVEEGDSYVVIAEFLDANDEVIVVPWDVAWQASSGILAPGDARQRQVLRGLPAGEIDVVATSGPFRAALTLAVRPGGGPRLTVPHFTMWADALPNGRMAFYPDLVVVAPFEATVVKLAFDQPARSVCTNATTSPEVTTPLFDFIPYDVSWQDGALAPGSVVEASITYRHRDGSLQMTRAVGLVTTLERGSVIDYSTGNFRWGAC